MEWWIFVIGTLIDVGLLVVLVAATSMSRTMRDRGICTKALIAADAGFVIVAIGSAIGIALYAVWWLS